MDGSRGLSRLQLVSLAKEPYTVTVFATRAAGAGGRGPPLHTARAKTAVVEELLTQHAGISIARAFRRSEQEARFRTGDLTHRNRRNRRTRAREH